MNLLTLPNLATAGRGTLWACAQCHILATPPRTAITPTTSLRYLRLRQRSIGTKTPYLFRNGRGRWKHNGSQSRKPYGRKMLYASTGAGAATATALAFTDDIKQGFETVERIGRVGSALVVCINDYRATLSSREKIEDDKEQLSLLKECHKRCALRTLKVLEENGGIFIKLGQHLSAMNYLLPPEWTNTFIPLQDRCPVSSFESIQKMFRDDTGQDLFDYFSDFAPEPIGAASLAQVHLATVKETGQKVAVKLQHPELAQWAPLDLRLTTFTFDILKRFFPEYDLSWLSSEMEISLPVELDFEREAENAIRTKKHFSHVPELPLVIPDVIWARRRILVMACEAGHRLDDLEYLDANGIDRDEVSASLSRIFNEMIFSPGAPLHCDPHGGNIAIRRNDSRKQRRGAGGHNFDVILYDHGLYRDIPLEMRRNYAKMWLAVIDGDIDRMRKYAYEVAGITEDKFELFASAITGRDFTTVSDRKGGGVTGANGILTPRTTDEKDNITDALQDGMLSELVQMLGQVPRVILLILKTNDLTRALDESLHTRQGPVRTFLILAQYCTKAVFLEQIDEIQRRGGSLFWPTNAARLAGAYVNFLRVELKLSLLEMWLAIKRALGLQNVTLAGF